MPEPTAPSPLGTPLAWDLVAPGYVEFNTEFFEVYSAEALKLAEIRPKDHLLDVAAGPGSLSLQAAERAEKICALDFSPEMLTHLRARAKALNLSNIDVLEGDGQALPYPDQQFDAAFSMFGLMFFPDRAKGFSELFRTLKPGGRAVVSSWQANFEQPFFSAIFDTLAHELPNLPLGGGEGPPLSNPDVFQRELSAAGFEVVLHPFTHRVAADQGTTLWQGMRRSFAPLVLLENNLGSEAFAPVARSIENRMKDEFAGPVLIDMPAWLAVGRRPLTPVGSPHQGG
ncbi:class I SAM-dependent methyltransferase [Marinimicrobium sp. ABcell2]|uniref:class I SAM-dependent methyltransferase n=1 Tax=Marinimicrobium sp. ABcell2 TaxID=3069751 RepID=UPI0027B404DE|nr:methyltransferase domain-containing protein [Marinimicrobium sp. ABcell2]MDQ2075814.1 methyltransferase domain-containing protein [Marinimicrobium sp. ABcell2]